MTACLSASLISKIFDNQFFQLEYTGEDSSKFKIDRQGT